MSNQEPVLNSHEQYISELSRFARLSEEEQRALVEQAREGGAQARERLILECMHFVEYTAALYARTYLRYDDFLDLVQIGNLALVEHIDTTLSSGKGLAYLCAIARQDIRYYCAYRSQIIALPTNKALPQPHERPSYISLEETWMTVGDVLAEEGEAQSETLYGPLQEALATLSDKEREVVSRHYGLDGYPTESLVDISKDLPLSANATYVRYYRALGRLRARLKRA